MGISLTARVTELVNPTSRSVLLYECEENDPNGRFCTPIEVKPFSTKEIRASRFLLNHEHARNPRTIRVKRIDSDNFENESYRAQYFLIHHRIIFSGEEGPLEVEAVKDPDAGGIFTEFRRTKYIYLSLDPHWILLLHI